MDLPAQLVIEIAVGSPLPVWSLESVSAERMKLLAAILRDPNPIHWDAREVAKRGLGERVINQGPTNLGYVTNMLMAWAGPTCLRRLDARFTSNVFAGDRVVAGGVVTAVREHDGERLIECEVWLDRDDGTRAVVGSATIAFDARDGRLDRRRLDAQALAAQPGELAHRDAPVDGLADRAVADDVDAVAELAELGQFPNQEGQLSDHDAITQLFATYAWAHDNKEFTLLDGVFTDLSDFTVDISGGATVGPFHSRRETVDFIRDTTINQGDQRRHVITNVRFSDDSDRQTRVTAILSLFVTVNNELTVQATGWYDCRAVLDGDSWRFARMYLTLDRTY